MDLLLVTLLSLSVAGAWLGAFAAGSIPFGFLVARARGRDIRREGSGNIGATNVGRVMGTRFAILVFILDFAKGLIPTLLVARMTHSSIALFGLSLPTAVTAAILAVLGHMYSPFLRFRGGKGVATALGGFVALSPEASLSVFGIWVLVLLLSGFVSLASLIASWAFPLLAYSLGADSSIRWGGAVIALFITWRHRSNIARLLRGEEPKKRWKKKDASPSVSVESSVGESR